MACLKFRIMAFPFYTLFLPGSYNCPDEIVTVLVVLVNVDLEEPMYAINSAGANEEEARLGK